MAIRFFLIVGLTLSLFSISANASTVLYGVFNTSGTGTGTGDGSGSANGQGSTLVTVNQTTGELTEVGSIGFGRVSGIVYDPDSDTLFATGGNATRGPFDFNTQLLTINRTTGAGTAIGALNQDDGPINAGGNVSGLARNSDGEIYGYNPTTTLDVLLNLNPVTGVVDSFVQTGWGDDGFGDLGGNGITFVSDDVLIHANSEAVSTIDPDTGATVIEAPLDFGDDVDGARVSAMDIDPITGEIYASVIIKSDGAFDLSLLAILIPGDGFVGVDYIGLSTLNDDIRKLDAIAFVEMSPVPVPAAVWLFGTALIGFIGVSRRRKVA